MNSSSEDMKQSPERKHPEHPNRKLCSFEGSKYSNKKCDDNSDIDDKLKIKILEKIDSSYAKIQGRKSNHKPLFFSKHRWKLFFKILYEYTVSEYIIIRTSPCWHIKGPFFYPRVSWVLTKSHIVSSSSLVKFESFLKIIFFYFRRKRKSFIFCFRYKYFRISKIHSVSIRYKSIISNYSQRNKISSILWKISSTFYFCMGFLDLRKMKHSFL